MKKERILLLAAAAAFLAGCASAPEIVRTKITEFAKQRNYKAARAVPVKSNLGGFPKTEEEAVKEQLIRDLVNPAEIKDLKDELTSRVESFLSLAHFNEARDVIREPMPDLVPEVAQPIAEHKAFLVRERINPAETRNIKDKLTAKVEELLKKERFADARAAVAAPMPDLVPEVAKPVAEHKNRLLHERIDPAEIKSVKEKLSAKVEELVKGGKFDDARDAVWDTMPDLVPEVAGPVAELKSVLLLERINRTQFLKVTNDLTKAVSAAVAKKDFGTARKAIEAVRPVRVYSSVLTRSLAGVRKTLVSAKVPEAEVDKLLAGIQPVLEKLFEDLTERTETVPAGERFKPDDKAFRKALGDFRKKLEERGVAAATTAKIASAVESFAETAFRELWDPKEDLELAPPLALGTTKLNQMVQAVKEDLYENVVVPAQLAYNRERVGKLLEEEKPDEARAAAADCAPTGLEDLDRTIEEANKDLYENTVVPAHVALRAKKLRATVFPLVEAGKLAQARAAIHSFGVTGLPEVDDPVFAVKLGLLNACVNVAEWDKRSENLPKAVEEALKAGAFEKATAAVAASKPVPAYGVPVDEALDEAASGTADLGFDAAGADRVVADARTALYGEFAPRPDDGREARIMKAYLAEAAGIANAKAGDEPDWSEVRKALDKAAELLVADDLSKEDADAFMDEVFSGFKALAGGESGPSAITTEELNRRIAALNAELTAKIAAAVSAKMAAEAKAKSEANASGRKMALDMAERAAAEVDFDARINAFVDAVSERSEDDVNRILGDGARALRLRRAGATLSREDAASLFAASVWMGFDDAMNLALVLGADVDAPSPKDSLARPPLLLAIQSGFKGRSASFLQKANRGARDAKGDGALHYAVRALNGTALLDMLRDGVDAKTPGAGGATPIVLAADLGYAGFVQALVPFSDLEKADSAGFTALLRAAQNGRLDIVRNLVAAKADLGAKTAAGDGALELAAMANAQDLLVWLLDEKKVVPSDRVVSQLVAAGNVPTLQLVAAHGAKLRDEHLALAVRRGDFPMVKCLVNRGMDVNAECVKDVVRRKDPKEPEENPAVGPDAGPNDGTFYGPDGDTIRAFLREQGQRL